MAAYQTAAVAPEQGRAPTRRRMRVPVDNPIRTAREAAGLSLRDLADKLGVKAPTIFYWEIDSSLPGPDRLRALRAALAPHFDLEVYLVHAERVGVQKRALRERV